MIRWSIVFFTCFVLFLSSFTILNDHTELITPEALDLSSRFSGGDGSAGDPYQISNVNELQNISAALHAHYILINDINASATKTWNWNGNVHLGFEPLGLDTNPLYGFHGIPFTGTLNGNDHTIFDLTIDRAGHYYIGIFGLTQGNARIFDLSIKDIYVTGEKLVGGIVGEMENTESIVENCTVSGFVQGTYNVGGVVGLSRGNIKNCESTAAITGDNYIGCVLGHAHEAEISYCSANGTVDAISNSGGSIGWCVRSEVISCNSSSLIKCDYNSGGGLVGVNSGSNIRWSSSSGHITGTCNLKGGLVGTNNGIIKNCFTTATISGGGYSFNGLVGENTYSIEDSFYCVNYTSINGEFIPTYNGMYKEQFDDWLENSQTIDINDHMEKEENGARYLIENIEDLRAAFTFAFLGDYDFVQTSDIDLSNEVDLNIPVLRGDYDGNGHLIKNADLLHHTYNHKGFFGNNFGTITNLTLKNCDFYGQHYLGTVVGQNYGNVFNCHSNGWVTGTQSVGGLVGINRENGKIKQCSSETHVSSSHYNAGGLIGENEGDIKDCYAIESVHGNTIVGGFCGLNKGTITRCYCTGDTYGNDKVSGFVGDNRSIIEDCLWESPNPGITNNDTVENRTTEQMKQKDTFTDLGWNFYSIWDIEEGQTFPYLRGAKYGYGLREIRNISFVDEHYGHQLERFLDIPGADVELNMTTSAHKWLNINDEGWIFGTPSNYDEGKHWVNISNKIGNLSLNYNNYTLCVIDLRIPSIATEPIVTAFEDQLYSVDFDTKTNASPDWNWYLHTNAYWLSIEQSSGIVSGTPTNSEVGSFWVTITIVDEYGNYDFLNYTLEVKNANDPPFVFPEHIIATEDVDLIYQINIHDDDLFSIGDEHTFELSYQPDGMTINASTGVINWLPTNTQASRTHSFTINCSDKNLSFDQKEFTIYVNNTNDPPKIISKPRKLSEHGLEYIYDVEVSDDDLKNPSGEFLTFQLIIAPEGMMINSTTGSMNWTPSFEQVNKWHNVSIIVQDMWLVKAYQNYSVYVNPASDPSRVNRLPEALYYRSFRIDEDTIISNIELNLMFMDPDGDKLTVKVDNTEHLTANIEKGLLEIIPEEDWFGEEDLVFYVADDFGIVMFVNPVTVNPVNDAPENQKFDFVINKESRTVTLKANPAIDPDDEKLTYVWNLGDGTTLEGMELTHTYSTENSHNEFLVSLVISDGKLNSAPHIQVISFYEEDPEAEPEPEDDRDYGGSKTLIVLLTIGLIMAFIGIVVAPAILFRGKDRYDIDPFDEEAKKNDKQEPKNKNVTYTKPLKPKNK